MEILVKPCGDFYTNCYIVDRKIIIDPGVGAFEFVKEHVKEPVAIINTHGHFDHMWDDKKIKELLESFTSLEPHYDFESFDHSHHKLWCISDHKDIEIISKQLRSINSLYIADGHHRMGAMNIISQNYKKYGAQSKQNRNCDGVMIAAFPAEQSKIYDYNRVIKDLNGLSKRDLLEKLKENFKITISDSAFKPKSNRQFGMYHHGKWYSLEFIGNIPDENDILSLLDINIINNYCLISGSSINCFCY